MTELHITVPMPPAPSVRETSFFVPHIGMVTVNDRGAVRFQANSVTPVGLVVREGQEGSVIVHADTIKEIGRGVAKAMRRFERRP